MLRAATVALLLLAVPGCILFSAIGALFSLLIEGVCAVGEGVATLAGTVVRAEPLDGPAPTVTALGGGRWRVDPAREPSRFRLTVAAPDHAPRTFVWPDDFRGAAPGPDGVAHVRCLLAAR